MLVGVDRIWVDHDAFLAKVIGKTGSKLYGKASGADYADNLQANDLSVSFRLAFPRYCSLVLAQSADYTSKPPAPNALTCDRQHSVTIRNIDYCRCLLH